MQRIDLWNPSLFGGLKSAQDPLNLVPGECSAANNLRKDIGGPIKVRSGVSTAVAAATGLATGASDAYKGASEFYNDGTYVHQAIAWKEADNDVHLYHRKYTIASDTWSNWALVTADSGKFGATRLTSPANGRVNFAWFDVPADDQTTTGKDYHTFRDAPAFMASDGTSTRIGDLDIIVNGSEIGEAAKIASHANSIPPPDKGSVTFSEYDSFDMSLAATATGASAGDWGTVGSSNSTWVFTTTAGSGTPAKLTGSDEAYIAFNSETVTYATYTSDEDYFLPEHFCLIAHASSLDWWENVDVYLQWKATGGSYDWVLLPTPLVLPTNIANYEMVVFKLPDQLPQNALDLIANGLRFVTRTTTPVSTTCTVYSMFFGGVVRGGTEYGIARRNRSSHVMSPGVICGDTTFGTKTASTRGVNEGLLDATDRDQFNCQSSSTLRANSPALPANFILPIDSRVSYTPKIKFSDPHQGDLDDNGADYVCIYRKEPGESDFYRVDRIACAEYASSTWSYESGHSASATKTYTDLVPSAFREFKDRLPDESNAPPPPFMAARTIGPRTILLEKSPYGVEVKISEQGQPIRFSNSVAVSDDTKGAFNIKVAGETGRAVAQSSFVGNSIDSSQALIFTDHGTWSPYRMQGDVVLYDLRPVNGHGSSTFSTAEGDGYVAYLDKDRDVRIIGLDGSISRYKVSDVLNAIPDGYVGIADIAYWKGRIYIAYTVSAGTQNTRVLVYNIDGEYWESVDTFPSGKEPQQFFNWRIGGANKLYFIASDGAIYEYEKSGQTTDAGTAISFLIQGPEFHNNRFDPVNAESVGVVADTVSVTLTTLRTESGAGGTESATIDLSTGTSRTWKWDTFSGKSQIPGLEGPGITHKITGSFSVACSFYAIVADIEGTELGGASR